MGEGRGGEKGIPVPRVTNCMNAHTRGDTCVASRAEVSARACECACTRSLARQEDWLGEGGVQVLAFSTSSISGQRLKIIPTFGDYKNARPLFRQNDSLTDHRRHSTPTRYPLFRLERRLLTGGRGHRWMSPVRVGISKPLDRKDEIATPEAGAAPRKEKETRADTRGTEAGIVAGIGNPIL